MTNAQQADEGRLGDSLRSHQAAYPSLRPTPMQAGNGYWEEPDLAGRVDGHRGPDQRSHIRSTQRATEFVISVLEHQRER